MEAEHVIIGLLDHSIHNRGQGYLLSVRQVAVRLDFALGGQRTDVKHADVGSVGGTEAVVVKTGRHLGANREAGLDYKVIGGKDFRPDVLARERNPDEFVEVAAQELDFSGFACPGAERKNGAHGGGEVRKTAIGGC